MGKFKPVSTTKKETVILERYEGKVARIVINRPEKRNSWSFQQLEDYFSTLEELEKDDSVKVVVTTGVEKSWSAGRDVSDLRLMMLDPKMDYEGYTHYDIWDRVRLYPKVTIAAVNGFCLGGALTLMINHDIAIASLENAKFGLPEVFRGFVPRTPISSLFKAIPRKLAFDMTLTGQNFDATKALQCGLVSRVVPHAELEDASLEMATMIGGNDNYDPIVLKCCKLGAHYAMDISEWTLAMEMGSNYHWIAQHSKPGLATGALESFKKGEGPKAKF
jgi:enoyl-CoA hydratase/carnithine racemase